MIVRLHHLHHHQPRISGRHYRRAKANKYIDLGRSIKVLRNEHEEVGPSLGPARKSYNIYLYSKEVS
jgi:hypothetical protein